MIPSNSLYFLEKMYNFSRPFIWDKPSVSPIWKPLGLYHSSSQLSYSISPSPLLSLYVMWEEMGGESQYLLYFGRSLLNRAVVRKKKKRKEKQVPNKIYEENIEFEYYAYVHISTYTPAITRTSPQIRCTLSAVSEMYVLDRTPSNINAATISLSRAAERE